MSVWDNHQQEPTLPADTPLVQIRYNEETGLYSVLENGEQRFSADMYPDAHRWVLNEYRLSQTQGLVVYEEYAASRLQPAPEVRSEQPAEAPQSNRFRKPEQAPLAPPQ